MPDVSFQDLHAISTELSSAANDIGAAGSSRPDSVDGGDATPDILAILSYVTQNSAYLAEILDEASTKVSADRSDYITTDDGVGNLFGRIP